MTLFHPLLVHFPVGLWVTSFFFDTLNLLRPDTPMYPRVSFWLIGLGLLGAAVSIPGGWLDYLRLLRQGVADPFGRVVFVHQVLAYATTAVYLAIFLLRWRRPALPRGPRFALALLAAGLIAATAWYGTTARNMV